MRTPIGLLNRQNELCRLCMPFLGDSSRGVIIIMGVTTEQALVGTDVLQESIGSSDRRMAASPEFRGTLNQLRNRIESTPGVPDGQNVLQEIFTYRGTEYRIDLDSYRGNGRNLSQ